MNDFNEDPLDLFGDDGDGLIEVCTIFDEKKNGNGSGPPSGNSGCCVVLLIIGASLILAGWGVVKVV